MIMADQVLAAASRGERVLVVSSSRRIIRNTLEELAAAAPPSSETRVRRAHGHERIEMGAGVIRFVTPTGCRGLEADLAYVLDDKVVLGHWVVARVVWPCLLASGGTLVNAC